MIDFKNIKGMSERGTVSDGTGNSINELYGPPVYCPIEEKNNTIISKLNDFSSMDLAITNIANEFKQQKELSHISYTENRLIPPIDLARNEMLQFNEDGTVTVMVPSEPELSLRYNDNKLPIHLVPTSAIEAMAAVLAYGKNKYAERNWEKGHMYSVPYASLMRHLMAWWGGEDNDPESGLPHVQHVLMNAAMLVEYTQMNKDFDDRPKK